MPLSFKRPRSPNTTPDKADKSAKVEKCVKCNKSVVDDCIACDWCSSWEHRSCANISLSHLEVLAGENENIVFFCSHCLPEVPNALTLYQTYSKLDTEFAAKFQSMENQLHKGVGQQVVKCFEAANVAGLEDVCKKLQKSVTELESKIANLSLSNNSLQMEIDNASESLTNSSQIGPAPVAPCPGTTMSIIDELADRDRRKRNIIVYNLPESSGSSNKSDSDAFAALCSSVYNSSFAVTKSIRLGKKAPDKHRPLLLCLQKEEDKFELLSRSFLLFRSESYKNVYLAPDRTKFEREKHKKLVTELRVR